MLTILQSVALGAVEGLTEFLPISSSGHLILARELLHANTENGLAFDAIIQLGTILAVVVVFREDILRLIASSWKIVTGRLRDVRAEDRTLLFGIVLGTIPALAFGLLLEKKMDTAFRNAFLVACMLVAGSLLMWFAEKRATRDALRPTPSLTQSWWIGWFQTLALVPGVSRSGATISGGLLLGLNREAATRFSFLLSLPVITGGGLLKTYDVVKHGADDFTIPALAAGFATSFAVGYLCIRWLLRYLKTHSLLPFVWYRLGLAAAVFAFLATQRPL